MSANRPHAEIAGAGFAGLAAATALCQRGWSARVHEANPDLRAFGAGIFIWENGLRVLKALGAYEDVMTGSHQAPGYEGRNHHNERISLEVFGPQRGSRMVTMTRQHLYSAMLLAAERAGVEFVTSSKVVSARPEGELVTAGGRAWRADLVVGADGVKSNVRQSLGVMTKRTKYNYGVIRLLVSRGKNDTPRTNPDNVINYYSPDHRVLYVPCSASELYLALAARDRDKASTAIPVRKDIWSGTFLFLAPIFERIGDEGRYDTYETNKLPSWSVGRVALVGDSAHSMPPTLGQGAGCALMNALSLAVSVHAAGDDVLAGLRAWQQQERPLTDHTQSIASRYAETRAGSEGGSKWDAAAMLAARHVPTGTEDILL
ncbi:MAG: FAD-dependent monooxygenase [Betaproteobacteria bacterium]|nr:FAD-dependent monooxygenase [Betaproteobacteria bacterium]